MPERLYILHVDSQQHRERFLTALASLPGFICFGNPASADGERIPWMSALPSNTFTAGESLITGESLVRDTMLQMEKAADRMVLNQRLAGILCYEAGYGLDTALERIGTDQHYPALIAGLYDWHLRPAPDQPLRYELYTSSRCDDEMVALIKELVSSTRTEDPTSPGILSISHFTQDEPSARFQRNVARILDYILAGDCYQVNLSHRFRANFEGNLWLAYRHLIDHFPTGHAAFLNIDGEPVLSISPESFLEIENGKVITKPIKGTRPRGTSPEEDTQLANDLTSSEKDRAENIMIVDLLRNDLGRFCQPGSIRAEPLLALESYRNVHHLVSTVSGDLSPEVPPIRALAQAFPGGSITGAPKIRAMEIIHELETNPRGPYCGSVFSVDDAGDLYSNIAIRTLYARGNTLYCHGGGGIVADSDPASEYQETLDKVGPMMEELRRQFGGKQ